MRRDFDALVARRESSRCTVMRVGDALQPLRPQILLAQAVIWVAGSLLLLFLELLATVFGWLLISPPMSLPFGEPIDETPFVLIFWLAVVGMIVLAALMLLGARGSRSAIAVHFVLGTAGTALILAGSALGRVDLSLPVLLVLGTATAAAVASGVLLWEALAPHSPQRPGSLLLDVVLTWCAAAGLILGPMLLAWAFIQASATVLTVGGLPSLPAIALLTTIGSALTVVGLCALSIASVSLVVRSMPEIE